MRTVFTALLMLAALSLGLQTTARADDGKSGKSHKSGKSDKSDKSDKSRRSCKSCKSGKSEKSHRSCKSGRSDKSEKSRRSCKSGKSDKSCKGRKRRRGKSGCEDVMPPLPANQPPIARDTSGRFPARGTTVVPAPGLLNSASDPDGDPISISGFDTQSTLGATITVEDDGSFGYRPFTSAVIAAMPSGSSLVDTFTVTFTDSRGGFATSTVTITVFK